MPPKRRKMYSYKPLCPCGKTDCINDPAYILYHYPKWYEELYGDTPPNEVIKDEESGCSECDGKTCQYYDDEDK